MRILTPSIIRGLQRRQSQLDVVQIQDVGLTGADDPTAWDWATKGGPLLLTHDAQTMIEHGHQIAGRKADRSAYRSYCRCLSRGVIGCRDGRKPGPENRNA